MKKEAQGRMHNTNTERNDVICLVFISNFILTTGPKECSVGLGGVLSMFNGDTSTVAVPCRYPMADIRCGNYRLMVCTESKLDSHNDLSPSYVRIKISNTDVHRKIKVKTRQDLLQQVSHRAFLLCDGTIKLS